MSQEQPLRPQEGDQTRTEPLKYGDVFDKVSGDLASQPVAPQDAAMMQTAENMMFGQTQKGGPASVMQSAATRNERAGLVGHTDSTDIAVNQGVTVIKKDYPGARVVTETVGGQVIGQYVEATPVTPTDAAIAVTKQSAITIGEALEATAHTAGEKPVEQSDASAIQAAEVRATGSNVIEPGGIAASAQAAAAYNAAIQTDENKVKLGDVLTGAAGKLPADKAVTRQDAEGVVGAELRNNPHVAAHPGGVAASIAAAARLNESTGV